MPGSLYQLENESTVGTMKPGDQPGFNAVKALLESVGGLVQVGPGLEGIVPGTFLGTKTVFVRAQNDGKLFISGLRHADPVDPTKAIFFDLSAIATATERGIIIPGDWGGYLQLPPSDGTAGEFLRSSGPGGQPFYAPVSIADLSHNGLGHLAAFSVANCTSNASDTIVTTTTPNGFANVRVGDRIDGTFIAEVSGLQSHFFKTVTQIDSSTQIRTSGTKNIAGTASVTIIPDDHRTLLLMAGRGDQLQNYSTQPYADGACQLVYGNYRFLPGPANLCMVEFKAVSNPANPDGFCLRDDAFGARFFFDFQNPAAGTYVISIPFGGSDTLLGVSAAQNVTNKALTTGNTIRMDPTGGAVSGSAFRDAAASTKGLGFDLTGITAGQNRVASWPDLPGRVILRTHQADQAAQNAAIGSTTLATAPPPGMYRVSVYMACTAAGAGSTVAQLSWNDGAARGPADMATLDMTGTNFAQATFVVYVASGNVSYNVTYGGSGTYDVRIRMEAL
jgi:hypothetical protein